MKKPILFVSFCAFFFVCPELFATVFTVVPTDQSLAVLSMVFGGSVGPITLGSGGPNTLLSQMFVSFNFIVVAGGVIVLSYIGVVGAVNTAREGEALGKKFTLWLPIRAISGMLLLIPGPSSGFSLIQATVLWIVLNGIGAANSVWNIVVTQIASQQPTVGTANLPFQTNNLLPTIRSLLSAVGCMQYINSLSPLPYNPSYGPVQMNANPPGPVNTATNSSGNTTYTQTVTFSFGPANAPDQGTQNICGQFQISSSVTPTSTAYVGFTAATMQQRSQIKSTGFANMVSAINPVVQLAMPPNPTLQISPPFPQGYVQAAMNAYVGQLGAFLEKQPPPSNQLSTQYQNMMSLGWIIAGNYYRALVGVSNATIDQDALSNYPVAGPLLPPGPAFNGPPPSISPQTLTTANNSQPTSWSKALWNAIGANTTQSNALNSVLCLLDSYWQTDQNSTPPNIPTIAVAPPNFSPAWISNIINQSLQGVFQAIQQWLFSLIENPLTQGDPLMSVQSAGYYMMLAGEAATILAFGTSFGVSYAVSAASCLNPFAWAGNLLLVQIMPIVFGIPILLWGLGATFNIYLPMVPYIVFLTSAVGWLLQVVEAVVGAPIIAFALTHPTEGELGKLPHALGILASIFLRPVLMIFGFVLAAGVLRALLGLLNFGFMNSIIQNTQATVLSFLPVLGLYLALVIAIVNQSFSLIYILPDKILKFMGVQGEGVGETSKAMTGEAKGGFEKGQAEGGKAAGAGKRVMDSKIKKEQDKQEEDAKLARQNAAQMPVQPPKSQAPKSQASPKTGGGGAAPGKSSGPPTPPAKP